MCEEADCSDKTLKLEIKSGVELKKESSLFHLYKINLIQFNMC